jgi:membrane-associated phospholipid phosphatase
MIAPPLRRAIDAAVAVVAFAAFFALGDYVVHTGEPASLVAVERALLDHSTMIAWWVTWSCYVYVLVPLFAVLCIVAWRVPAWRSRIVLSLVVMLVCWQAADLFQHFFARPRRLDWVVKHESAFSYPSSHAAISTGFYAFWGCMILASDLRASVRLTAGPLLLLFTLAIWWSRLSLGAHYITDIVGGVLLALAVVAAALAVVPVKVFGARRARL